MQEKWNELQTILEEMKTMKKREYFLTLAVCVLSGLVIGIMMSPKKRVMIGSNNGNNNGNGNGSDSLEDFCDWDEEDDFDDDCCDCGK